MTTTATLRALIAGAIDYAGLFPPARLAMSKAVDHYANYLGTREAWALGRFVVPASRLEEFVAERRGVSGAKRAWLSSAILGPEALSECSSIRAFMDAHGAFVCVDSVEFKVPSDVRSAREQIGAIKRALPNSIRLFAELPAGGDLRGLVRATRAERVSAKIRTGGVTADAFPSPQELAEFLFACAEENVSFKATAGLHHPCRGTYPLTYETDAPAGVMFGFLNVLLAAVCISLGVPRKQIVAMLETEQAAQFSFSDDEVTWRGVRASRPKVERTRSTFALSFGSCSFEEPIQDLRALSLL